MTEPYNLLRLDQMAMMLCPECDSALQWITTGSDCFGDIMELYCANCGWCEIDEVREDLENHG